MTNNLVTLKSSELVEALQRVISVGLVPQIEGSPGIGKSDIVRQVAKNWGLKVIDLRLSQAAPEDLNGLPMRKDNKAAFLPFENFPIEGDKIPEGYNGWLIFLDEITSAPKSVQAAAYKLILDRQVGIHNLHPSVAMVAAGNKITDRAVVVSQSTALQSRLIHLSLEVDTDEWIEWAYKSGIDRRAIAYISYKRGDLYNFDPDHKNKTFPCPRTWEFVSRLIKGRKKLDNIDLANISGAITEALAVKFTTFCELEQAIPTMEAIFKDPENTDVPMQSSHRFFTVTAVVDHVDEKNMATAFKYINRFPEEFQVILLRGIKSRHPLLIRNQVWRENATRILRATDDEEDDYAPAQR